MDPFILFVLPAAFFCDLLFGDPPNLPHPIRWMGVAIAKAEPYFRKLPLPMEAAGTIFAVSLIFGAWLLTYLLVSLAGAIHPLIQRLLEILLIFFSLSARSLESAAMGVYRLLDAGELPAAKEKLALIVGRDVAPLDEVGSSRAAVETVAENLVDGVISPLFFAAIGGAPLAMAYKMVNTLDSMVGYKNTNYWEFGKAAAKIDDGANYIPARLSVPVIAIAAQILSGKGKQAFRTAMKEGESHTSPNAGFPEAAFAGTLEVCLGGPSIYGGNLVEKPYIGKRFGRVHRNHIPRACQLMLLSSLLWFGIVWMVSLFLK